MEKYERIIYRLGKLAKTSDVLVDDYRKAKFDHNKEELEKIVIAYNKIDFLFYEVEKLLRDYKSDKENENEEV